MTLERSVPLWWCRSFGWFTLVAAEYRKDAEAIAYGRFVRASPSSAEPEGIAVRLATEADLAVWEQNHGPAIQEAANQ